MYNVKTSLAYSFLFNFTSRMFFFKRSLPTFLFKGSARVVLNKLNVNVSRFWISTGLDVFFKSCLSNLSSNLLWGLRFNSVRELYYLKNKTLTSNSKPNRYVKGCLSVCGKLKLYVLYLEPPKPFVIIRLARLLTQYKPLSIWEYHHLNLIQTYRIYLNVLSKVIYY